jgi:DNA-binding NarL/FixJ family response regulator
MPDSTKATAARAGDPLTPREREVLALLAGGLSTADVAEKLGITAATVKVHLTHVFRKTGTANRVQACRYYLDQLRHDPVLQDEARPGSAIDRDDQQATSGPQSRDVPRRGARLTDRELQVLELVGAGDTTEAITRELGVSEATVKTHLTSIYKKTGSQNRIQAARYYLRHYGTAAAAHLTNFDDDIADIKARLHELQPALEEAQRLHQALEALQAARIASTR